MSVQDILMGRIGRARKIVIYSFLCNVVICGIVFFSILIGLGSVGAGNSAIGGSGFYHSGIIFHIMQFLDKTYKVIFYVMELLGYGYLVYGGWILGVGIFIGSLIYYLFLLRGKAILVTLVVGLTMLITVMSWVVYIIYDGLNLILSTIL